MQKRDALEHTKTAVGEAERRQEVGGERSFKASSYQPTSFGEAFLPEGPRLSRTLPPRRVFKHKSPREDVTFNHNRAFPVV